jgi:hypothetical protein
MGRFFVAAQKDQGPLCGVWPRNAVTFLQPGTLIYAILAAGTAKIAE